MDRGRRAGAMRLLSGGNMGPWTNLRPLALLACCLAGSAACSNEVVVPERAPGAAQGGGGSGGTQGGGGTAPPPDPRIDASAPDETTVVIRFNVALDAPTIGATTTYTIASDLGPLDVESANVGADRSTVRLTTEKQKLGVSYQLTIRSPGHVIDGLSDPFIAADTASFWASDFDSPTYEDYVVEAERAAVGEHCVIYVERGHSAMDPEESAREFDEKIFPIATNLYIDAPDFDENERIVILGLDGGDHYGGYFSAINQYPDDEMFEQWGYHSNEMEMVYINLAGIGYVDTTHVTPHEFAHLLYHERHGLQYEYFAYHDEGLAEAAVLAVHGENEYAPYHYVTDPSGAIGRGVSLVNWDVGDYDQYARAFLLWSYVASRLGGIEALGDIFEQDGHPVMMDAYFTAELGTDFMTTFRDMLVATWVQAATGPQGFEQLITLPGNPPTAPLGTTSLDLEPFGAAFFRLPVAAVDYPGTEGPNIRYTGLNASNEVDVDAPFDVGGGVLLAMNTHIEATEFTPEHSGPDVALDLGGSGSGAPAPLPPPVAGRTRVFLDPPPMHPAYREHLRKWEQARALAQNARRFVPAARP